MAKAAEFEPDRRRAARIALRLTATMRDGGKSRSKARVIDISTHGCRIECTSGVADDSWVWLSIAGLETQYCRVVWHCQEFVGLEFAKPLAEAGVREAAAGSRAAARDRDQGAAQDRQPDPLAGAPGGRRRHRDPRRPFAPVRGRCGGRGAAARRNAEEALDLSSTPLWPSPSGSARSRPRLRSASTSEPRGSSLSSAQASTASSWRMVESSHMPLKASLTTGRIGERSWILRPSASTRRRYSSGAFRRRARNHRPR